MSPVPPQTAVPSPQPAPPSLTPLEARTRLPFRPRLTSDALGWTNGVVAEEYEEREPCTFVRPPVTHHRLSLLSATPGSALGWQRLDGNGVRVERRSDGSPLFCLIPAGRSHQWSSSGGRVAGFHLLLPRGFVAGIAADAGFGSDAIGSAGQLGCRNASLEPLMRQLAAELREPGAGGTLLADALARTLCLRLLRSHADAQPPERERPSRAPPTPLTDAQVRRVRELMTAEFAANPSNADLARSLGLSTGHFERCFKAATGVSPRAYLLEVRVGRAAGLLREHPDRTTLAVALKAGFADHSHMTRSFRRVLGKTPSAVRRVAAGLHTAALLSLAQFLEEAALVGIV